MIQTTYKFRPVTIRALFQFMLIAPFYLAMVSVAGATTYIVTDTQLDIYAQSGAESTAHLIRSSKGIYNNGPHPWCGDRAYILFTDKDLFAMALAASISHTPVNFTYEDAAERKVAAGHVDFSCKVKSIWTP